MILDRGFKHLVSGHNLVDGFPLETEIIDFGMGCFWGAERLFWQLEGVWVTAVGYAGGLIEDPTYEQVCRGNTGHAEVVRVVYNAQIISLQALLKTFWEEHDPTQGMRQGNDRGSQYRSSIYCQDQQQLTIVESSKESYQKQLSTRNLNQITTEIAISVPFYYAEDNHQQYLHRIPSGYCGLAGTGVTYQ